MFIREQMGNPYGEFQYAVAMEDEYLDVHIWSPVSCRWTNWSFRAGAGRLWRCA